MASGKRWEIEKQKRLLLLGKMRTEIVLNPMKPRLIEIYLPFTQKKSFCTLYRELCQLLPWGQSNDIFKENTVCKRDDMKVHGRSQRMASLLLCKSKRKSSMCALSYSVWKGWWQRLKGDILYQAGWWRPDEACQQSSTKMEEGNMRMSLGKLYSAPCSQRGALPLLMEKPWLQLILNDCCFAKKTKYNHIAPNK